MGNGFISKLSLYDILAMLIPGVVVILFFAIAMGSDFSFFCEAKIPQWLAILCLLVVAYIVGLINHCFTSYFWREFSSHCFELNDIWNRKNRLTDFRKILFPGRVLALICWIILAVIFHLFDGLSYEAIPKWIIICLPALLCFVMAFAIYFASKYYGEPQKMTDELNAHYTRYYYVVKSNFSNDIAIIESQIAFLQNMLFPLALFYFLPSAEIKPYLQQEELFPLLVVMYSFFFLMIVPVIFSRQCKINKRVREDYSYLKNLECNEKIF